MSPSFIEPQQPPDFLGGSQGPVAAPTFMESMGDTLQGASDPVVLAEALETYLRHARTTRPVMRFEPYDWQLELYGSEAVYSQIMALCANRVGKTAGLTYGLACHLTGLYPDWWPGRRFDHPPTCWALGVSGEQIRDVLQKHLFGIFLNRDGVYFDGAGWVPNELVDMAIPYPSVGKLAKDVHVRHVTGGIATLSFKSYSQGQHALMGNEIDYILIDEEPEDPEIYPQCLIRTASCGGILALGMTPENGMTELVTQFIDDRKAGQTLINATWDDAPHLDEEVKQQILDALPVYQRDMRSKGIPLMGSGLIYQVSEDRYSVDPFRIPDHYMQLVGIDFGIDHPFAAVWGAYDPDSDTIYVTHTYRQSNALPPEHCAAIKAKGKWIPVVYPHDGDNREKGSGEDLISNYEDEINVVAKYGLENTGNKVEPGILDIHQRMVTDRFKVFSTCTDWFKEARRYHRKDGKIVKVDDDIMDATRHMAGMIGTHGEQRGMAQYTSADEHAMLAQLDRAAG